MRICCLFKKTIILVSGLFIMSLGIALSVKADLGLAPISCIPYIYSLRFSPSMGEIAIIMMILFILFQIILLRKNYQPVQLIQLPAAVAFGYFIDFSNFLLSDLTIASYPLRCTACLISCGIIGFGVFLEVKSALTYLPGEGLVAAIAETFHMEFGMVKILFDSFVVLFGAVSSLILIKRFAGIREGTIAAAVLVGCLVRFFERKITFFDGWLNRDSAESLPA